MDADQRGKVFEQLFFHASGLSPAFLQAFLLGMQKEPSEDAKAAAAKEVARVLGVLDGRLERKAYVAGDEFTIGYQIPQEVLGQQPDVVVTDHQMPAVSNAAFARKLRTSRPELPVLIVSGYAEVDGVDPDLARLTKPFRNAELGASLATLFPQAKSP